MYPNHPSSGPAIGVGYVPYFYEAGLHQLYQIHPKTASRPSHYSPAESLFARADRTQTVEQVIANGYFSVPHGDPISAVISDKQQTSWLGLDDVISQIRRRYEIHRENLYQIELGKCAAINAIYQHEAYQGPPNSKQTYAKHKAIQDLYEEERTERTTLWKDVSRLKVLIPEAAQLYLSAYRKNAILTDDRDDSP